MVVAWTPAQPCFFANRQSRPGMQAPPSRRRLGRRRSSSFVHFLCAGAASLVAGRWCFPSSSLVESFAHPRVFSPRPGGYNDTFVGGWRFYCFVFHHFATFVSWHRFFPALPLPGPNPPLRLDTAPEPDLDSLLPAARQVTPPRHVRRKPRRRHRRALVPREEAAMAPRRGHAARRHWREEHGGALTGHYLVCLVSPAPLAAETRSLPKLARKSHPLTSPPAASCPGSSPRRRPSSRHPAPSACPRRTPL